MGEGLIDPGSINLERGLFAHFLDAAERWPDAVALDDGALRLSYAETQARALALAARIAAVSVPGTAVAALLPQAPVWPIAVLACLAAGCVYLPLDTEAPAAHNAAILARARAGVVIALDDCDTGVLPPDIRCISMHADGRTVDAPPAPSPLPMEAAVAAPAFVIHTSGSTGVAKGIVLSQLAMLHQVRSDIASCGLRVGEHYAAPMSPATISPLRRLLAALLTGGTLLLFELRRVGIKECFARLRDGEITMAALFPSLLRAMADLPGARDAFRRLRVLRVGGEAAGWEDIAAWRAVLPADCLILFAYGSTELSPVLEFPIRGADTSGVGPVPAGWIVDGCTLALQDADGRTVKPGDAGEAVLRSRYLALGLWQDGRCVPGPFVPDPADAGYRVYRTGDWLRRLPDGSYVFLGRLDAQAKIRGHLVEPGATEAFLGGRPEIRDAAVLVLGSGDDAQLAAFVVPATDGWEATLRTAMSDELVAHQRPSRLVAVPVIPRLPSSKPDLDALRRLLDQANIRSIEGD